MKKYIFKIQIILGMLVVMFLYSCDSFLEADPPVDAFTSGKVFESDATATAAVNGIYAKNLMGTNTPTLLCNGGIGVMTGLCADELHDFDLAYQDYENNQIIFTEFGPVITMWTSTYETIYQINSCIEGLAGNENITPAVRDNLLGQMYFMRAFSYFYMTNLYGAVPVITTTDYTVNQTKPRSANEEVYTLIRSDLSNAESLLTASSTTDNIRPNLNAALALDARVNLYLKNYQKASDKASEVIKANYELETLDKVFKTSSKETIWQIEGVLPTYPNTFYTYFYSPEVSDVPTYTIVDDLYNSFEKGDQRKETWIGDYKYVDSITYHYPKKYTQLYEQPNTEDNVALRLSEQYLIRAEAETNLEDFTGAVADLNKIRVRAGLAEYTGNMDKASILAAITHENRVEFFTEWGHRWLDLKRTGEIETVMSTFKPETWHNYAKLWPVPQEEINKNPNLLPNNEGY